MSIVPIINLRAVMAAVIEHLEQCNLRSISYWWPSSLRAIESTLIVFRQLEMVLVCSFWLQLNKNLRWFDSRECVLLEFRLNLLLKRCRPTCVHFVDERKRYWFELPILNCKWWWKICKVDWYCSTDQGHIEVPFAFAWWNWKEQ